MRGGKAWVAFTYDGQPLAPEHGGPAPATLLMSSWDETGIIYKEELALLASDPTRRVDAEMLADVAGTPAPSALAYVCGPTGLVEAVSRDLVTLGYTPDRVLTERFGPTG